MSEISKLNGYIIKDAPARENISSLNINKIQQYDTVSSMIADTSLIVGMYVKTKGYYLADDGGNGEYIIVDDDLVADSGLIHDLDNGLKAKLISDKSNILVYGCKRNDSTFDNSTIINTLLNKEDYFNYLEIPEGTFYFSNPIEINKSSTIFKCKGIINYTGNDTAIKIKSNKNVLDIYRIQSTANGITIENENNSVYDQDIKIEKTYSIGHCLYINGIHPVFQVNYSCFECGTDGTGTRSENIYFHIPSDTNNSYINEINIINSMINNGATNYGIKAVNDGNSSCEIQYNMRGGTLENTTGVYSEGRITVVSFDYVRLHEFHNRTFLKLKGYVGRYAFSNCNPLHSTFVDWSEADDGYGRVFSNSGFIDTVTGYTHVGECVLSNQCVIPQHMYTKYKTIREDTTINNVYTQGLTNVYEVSTGGNTITLTLDGHVFSGAYINEMRIFVYGTGGSCVIKDQNNNTLATLSTGRYLLLFGGTYSSPTLEYILPDKRNS